MKTNLSKINFNLLMALHALLSERHVTRASKRLHLSQSAMSNLLKQLRTLFNDELLVRAQASRMIPTPRALSLVSMVADAVEKVQAIFNEETPFNPKTAKITFTLGLSDYTELILLPPLIQYLEKNAPGITLAINHVNFLPDCKLFEDDEVDLTIGMYNKIPSDLIARTLFTDRSVCIGWNKNPILQKQITGDVFSKAAHLIILYYAGRSELYSEKYIADQGLNRRVMATVPHTLSAMYSLPRTNLICIVLERAAKKLTQILPLKMQPVLFKQCTKCDIEMVWHPKNRNHPAHQWLRDIIISLAKKV